MRIAVCEDGLSDQITLRKTLEQTREQLELEFTVEFVDSGRQLLFNIENGIAYDLVILDIFLAEENGMEVARRLRERSDVAIAFVTMSEEFALEAYSVDPIHYLLKPVNEQGMEELFRRFFKRRGQPLKSLVLKSARRETELPLIHIREIRSRDKGIEISLRKEQETRWYAFPFKETEWIQEEPAFALINRGHLVNLEEVFSVDRECCWMKDGSRREISRRERQNV